MIDVIWEYNTERGHITAYLPAHGDRIAHWPYTNVEVATVCRRNRERYIRRHIWPIMRYYPTTEVTHA